MNRVKNSVFIAIMLLSLTACSLTMKSGASTWREQYDLGIRFLSEGKYEEAILAFTAAIEIDPKQAPAYVGRGDAYVGRAQVLMKDASEGAALSERAQSAYEKAVTDYLAALDLDGSDPSVYRKAADVCIVLGDTQTAAEILGRGVRATGDRSLQTALDELAGTAGPEDRPQDEPAPLTAEAAAEIVLAHEDMWSGKLMESDPMAGSNFAYFMDLDFDGVPEFIVQTPMMGTGFFTGRIIYQIQDENLIVVRNIPDRDSEWDDWDTIHLWQDRQTGEYFYVGYDTARAGMAWYANMWTMLTLQQGELRAENLYSKVVSDNVPAYYGPDSSAAITEAQFDQLQEQLESRAENLGDQRGTLIESWDPDASRDEKRSVLLEACRSAPQLLDRGAGTGDRIVDVVFTRQETALYESAVICGVDANGIERWSYQTPQFDATQLQRVQEIGLRGDSYYFNESGTITVLDKQSGQVVWTNDSFGGMSLHYAFRDNGDLLLCGYFGPDFCAIGADGQTLHRIESIDPGYSWPYAVEVDGSRAIVRFSVDPNGDSAQDGFPFYVDLNDWTCGFIG